MKCRECNGEGLTFHRSTQIGRYAIYCDNCDGKGTIGASKLFVLISALVVVVWASVAVWLFL